MDIKDFLIISKSVNMIPSNLVPHAVKIIKQTIPVDIANGKFYGFARLYNVDENVTLETAILTMDGIIHDFTFTDAKRRIVYLAMSSATSVELETYYPVSNDDITSNLQPYRVELRISKDIAQLSYSAEGEKDIINSLIQFGTNCLAFLHHCASRDKYQI